MARGSLVIGPGPGWKGRSLRSLASVAVFGGVIAAAGVATWFVADSKAQTLAESGTRDQARVTASVLAGLIEDRFDEIDATAVEWLADIGLPRGVAVQLSKPDGNVVGGAGSCVCAKAAGGSTITRVHLAKEAHFGGATIDSEQGIACSVAPITGADSAFKGYVTVHWRLGATSIADVLGQDLAVAVASTAMVAVALILAMLGMLSRWHGRLRVARDDRRRHLATARACGEVLARLAPHLAYEAETDDRVSDFTRTVEFVAGRVGTSMRRPVELGPLIGECLDRRHVELQTHDRELRRKLADGVWVIGEPERLALAIDHGVRNAIEALADQPGRVEVRLSGHFGSAEITIRDTGPRVSRRDRRRVFDAGFSTKPGHAGLGLALVRRVAEELDGYCELRHPWGGGTVLRICLPRVKAPKSGAQPSHTPSSFPLEDYLPTAAAPEVPESGFVGADDPDVELVAAEDLPPGTYVPPAPTPPEESERFADVGAGDRPSPTGAPGAGETLELTEEMQLVGDTESRDLPGGEPDAGPAPSLSFLDEPGSADPDAPVVELSDSQQLSDSQEIEDTRPPQRVEPEPPEPAPLSFLDPEPVTAMPGAQTVELPEDRPIDDTVPPTVTTPIDDAAPPHPALDETVVLSDAQQLESDPSPPKPDPATADEAADFFSAPGD